MSPITCDKFSQCPPGLFCDPPVKLCCPLLLSFPEGSSSRFTTTSSSSSSFAPPRASLTNMRSKNMHQQPRGTNSFYPQSNNNNNGGGGGGRGINRFQSHSFPTLQQQQQQSFINNNNGGGGGNNLMGTNFVGVGPNDGSAFVPMISQMPTIKKRRS